MNIISYTTWIKKIRECTCSVFYSSKKEEHNLLEKNKLRNKSSHKKNVTTNLINYRTSSLFLLCADIFQSEVCSFELISYLLKLNNAYFKWLTDQHFANYSKNSKLGRRELV